MPISRAAFQSRMPESDEIGTRQAAHAPKDSGSAAQQSGEAIRRIDVSSEDSRVASKSNADGDPRAAENPPGIQAETFPNLPSADEASAGTQEAVGPTQPQTETRRSVATGRDAPPFPPVREDREIDEINRGHAGAQTQAIEGRLQGQENATAEHLSRIHTIVERLMELTEAHSFEGDQKLLSLERKLDQLEMRFGLNRSSP